MSNFKANFEKYLVGSMNSKQLINKLYINIASQLAGKIQSLISYPGGKKKMETEIQECYKELSITKTFEVYIDPFTGMAGSFKALEELLKSSNVKKVILNDINTCIITFHENIRNHKDEMIDEFLEIIREKIIKKYKKLFLTVEEFEEVQSILRDEFYQLQEEKKFGVQTSIRLILLSAFNYSGVMSIKRDGDITFSKSIYDANDIKDFLFNTITRIETFNNLYTQFEIEFYNEDYFRVFDKFKKQPNTLWNIDTVYLKEDYSEYIESDMENLSSSDIPECSCNYGQKIFPHIEVLETLKEIDFIYNNNEHPILKHYEKKFNLKSKYFTRKESIDAKNATEVKEVREMILFQNNFPNRAEV